MNFASLSLIILISVNDNIVIWIYPSSFQHRPKSYIFIDCEGDPVQELTAIEVSVSNFEILDVFHAHASAPFRTNDNWSRRNIHGLSIDFINIHGFPSEHELQAAFHVWFSKRNSVLNFANNPAKESKFLNIKLTDVKLPVWVERRNCPAHQIALTFKKHETPIGNAACFSSIHSSYSPTKFNDTMDERTRAQKEWGFHCSLYDAYEIYWYFSHTCLHSFL